MRRKKQGNICPMCGTKAEPYKTWQLVSPLPDAQGRITITIMGMFECPNCGHKWRGVVSKIKAGGSGVEVEGARGKKVLGEKPGRERKAKIIEIEVNFEKEEEE